MTKVIKPIQMNDKKTGKIRTKIICILDCPNCGCSMELTESIKDDGIATGQLLVIDND